MQRREPRARRDRQQEPGPAPDRLRPRGRLLVAEQEHTRDQHERREEVRGLADEQERDVREPRAGGPHPVRDAAVAARDAESGIDGAIAQEREQQDHAQAREDPERGFAQTPDPGRDECRDNLVAFGLVQPGCQ